MRNKYKLKLKKHAIGTGMEVKTKMSFQLASVIVLIIAVTVTAIGIINYSNDISKMVSNRMEGNASMAKVVAQQVDLYVTGSIDTMKTVVNTLDFSNMDKYEKNISLAKVTAKNMQFKAIYITDLEGNVTATTNNRRDEGKNYKGTQWFQAAAKGQTYISEAFIDEDSKMPIIILAVPVEGTISGQTGVMAVDLRLDRLFYLTRDMKIGETGFSYIVDRAGNIIAHPDFQAKVLQKFNAVEKGILAAQKVTKGESGVEVYEDTEGRKVIGGYSLVTTTGWGVIVEQQYAEITQQSKASLIRTFTISLFFILLGLVISYYFARFFTKPILDMLKVVNRIKDGDLTERIKINASNEVGILQRAFNDMADNLASLIRDVEQVTMKIQSSTGNLENNAQLTAEAVAEIATVIDEVAAGSGKQITSVVETTEVVGQMVASVKNVTENSMEILKSSSQASSLAKRGVENIEQINRTMISIDETVGESAALIKELTVHTRQIGDIVQLIKQISDQTNLLALNAAIEAARAGEHGRGFSVVADEVRKLAEQSSNASGGIVALIHKIQSETDKVVKTMECSLAGVRNGTQVVSSTTQSFYEIIEETQKVASEVEAFTGVVQELTAGMDLVEQAIHEVSQISEATAAGTQSILASTEEQDTAVRSIHESAIELTGMVDALEKVMGRFKTDNRLKNLECREEKVIEAVGEDVVSCEEDKPDEFSDEEEKDQTNEISDREQEEELLEISREMEELDPEDDGEEFTLEDEGAPAVEDVISEEDSADSEEGEAETIEEDAEKLQE
ncbi:methyl-accepting chemotaxis protein [Geosporobacter subterraneus DSM 17957]|uniref:Methyl-accepting chemotaxis protein n=1 Tax=Geosporobacter subterraneus DSM 17957 TaxID=1121919 RepID=A0A1M6CPS6_9FIRM|nr:methyl-accepting chemotaxis protein [Geosporobacter subterraneus]SHI62960.1 methyl-accepting chemotaxis protein [Geosporobacter subterraneus DSM 17957]